MLEQQGYRVIVTLDERDATERISGGRDKADLILLDLASSPDETLAAGRRIRESCEHCRATPIVVIALDYGEEEEGRDDLIAVGEWVTYLEDANQLQTLLARLLHNESESAETNDALG